MKTLGQDFIQPPFGEKIIFGEDITQATADYDREAQTFKLSLYGNGEPGSGIGLVAPVAGHFICTSKISNDSHSVGGWVLINDAGKILVTGVRSKDGNVKLKGSNGEVLAEGKKQNYQVIQIERSDGQIILRAAGPNEPLQVIGSSTLSNLQATIRTGLWIENSSPSSSITFKEVRFDQPVSDDYDGDKLGHLGSRLEVLDILTGERKVIFESNQRFEAPNFMPDGKKLLFNMNGLLYTIPIDGGSPEKFNTGFANRNNNDHGISFDGKLLAISHHRYKMPGGGSTVYVMPLTGGEPKLITEETPSYWHGWNPNNQEVAYVAQRNGSTRYQLYKKDIFGGPEVALTNFNKGHVDGPEYSPDGTYIYYNGSQTGTMQLWRMSPDGKNPEQITFDENNNWFPHLSPDGKWIAYLAFPPSINPDEHPAYKRVQLKLIPTQGGSPRVLTHLYGGQGTINVPSWSPDNRYIAFVSNSRVIK